MAFFVEHRRLFACIQITLNLCSCLAWSLYGDPRKAFYWLFAAALTCTVTF